MNKEELKFLLSYSKENNKKSKNKTYREIYEEDLRINNPLEYQKYIDNINDFIVIEDSQESKLKKIKEINDIIEIEKEMSENSFDKELKELQNNFNDKIDKTLKDRQYINDLKKKFSIKKNE